ncbi:intein-containing DNA polymerase precursor [Salmonella phage GSP003]|nr:intein-containing DNA polymerase precursor [Salmonella phage GSP003]
MNLLYLDTETFSEADLKKVGSYAYAEHPTTEIVICTYAFDEGPVQVWDATDGSDMPRDLRRAMLKLQKPDSNLKLVGQNFLMFDRPVIKHCWGFELLVENIIDTMIVAFRHALPGSLAALCEVLNIDASMAKDKRGKALIQRFSKPTPKNYKIRRYTADTHPKEWAEFIAYAKSDITSMREVYKKMPKWGNSEFEDRVLWLDQVINDRGFKVDVALAEAAIEAVTRHKEELQEEAQRKYGGSLTGKDFLPILQELAPAHRIHNAQKSTLNDLLADEDLPDDARTIIEMRLGAASTASTKYAPLLLGRSSDDRRRGCLQYGGAKRTLRWAGKGFQPQNLARGYYHDDELDRGIAALLKGRAHRRFDVAKLTASTVRSCIIPEAGHKFVVADYSNVEGRGLVWLAGEETALDTFRAGLDIYCVTAGKMFGMDPDDIKKERKDLRQIGKACLHRHTQVLTDGGFKDIMAVTSADKVWSGEKWVNTKGAHLMGWKPVINVDGVLMTEDHRILTHSWKEAKQLVSNKYMMDRALEIGMDAWLSCANYQNDKVTDNYLLNAIAERFRGASGMTMSEGVKPLNATAARLKQQKNIVNSISATKTQCRTTSTERDYSTDYQRRYHEQQSLETRAIKTTGPGVSRYLTSGGSIKGRFLDMFKLWKAGMTQTSKWTESTQTVTTNLETFGLSAVLKTAVTDGKYPSFNESMMQPLPALLNLNGKLTYCEPVYDLIDVEDGNRFLIASDSGFLVAHNCELGLGYEGGVGAFVTFAKNLGLDLIEMAKTMDGTFPDHIWAATARGYEWARIQEAKRPPHPGEKDDRPSYILDKKVWRTCDAIKRMWRESHPQTVAFWRDLKDGILAAVRNPGRDFWAGANIRNNGERAIRIWRTTETDSSGRNIPGWWLCMELPSGRILSYPGIGVSVTKETDEDGRVNTNVRIKYQGENQLTRQWTTLYTHGGKACENIVQAFCRDLLAYAMLNVEAGGYPIVLSVHDELVCETPDTPDYTVAELEKLMCALPEWAEGFPLVAEGAELKRYAK